MIGSLNEEGVAEDMANGPAFDDHAVGYPENGDPGGRELALRGWDPEQFARVDTLSGDADNDLVPFGHNVLDPVGARRSRAKHAKRSLQPFQIGCTAWRRTVVDEVG
jgi:hypothetical protein